MATLGDLVNKKPTLGSLLGKTTSTLGGDSLGTNKIALAPLSGETGSVSQSTPSNPVNLNPSPLSLIPPILQAGPRAGAALVETGKQLVTKQAESYSPESPVSKLLLGNEPVKSLQAQGADVQQAHPNIPAPAIALGVAGSEVLDLLPFGGKANALKDIVAAKDITEAAVIARKLGINPDLVEQFSKQVIETETTKDAQSLIDTYTNLQKTTINSTKGVTSDLPKIGEQRAVQTVEAASPQEMSLADETATSGISLEARQIGTQGLSKIVSPSDTTLLRQRDLINLDRIKVGDEASDKILSTIEEIRPDLEAAKGAPITSSEVLRAAQDSAILTKATSREATLKSEAALLATRQNLAALAEGKGISKDFIDQLRIVSQEATRRGRELQALGIGADPLQKSTKAQLIKKLLDIGVQTDDLINKAENVDFNNLGQVTAFYRAFVKPTKTEWLDEYRYINLLSSPKTHIVNAFSNVLQATILNPATRLATGAIDFVMSGLTGAERKVYMKEVGSYTKGFLNAIPDASKSFLEALKGNIFIERPDVSKIPTGSKILRPFQVVPRMLEASDVFFRSLITEGEKQAIAARYVSQGKELTDTALADIADEAKKQAEYYVFRTPLDATNKTGQGHVLTAIDKATSAVYQLRKVPGVKWFVPFVQTPMNILKQGIEYSPLGLTTLPGAANKTAQVAKAMVGSVVFLGASSLALQGKVTWAAPTSKAEQDAFYNSGRQPYSVKIGDNWVSFSKLGPLAYPIAMAAAIQWYTHENPKAVTQSSFERAANAFEGIAQFFSDQSYMQGMKSLIDFASGESKLTGIQSAFESSVGQLIPLSSLLRWTDQIIDPIYRKPDTKFNAKDLIQSISKDIPGLSQTVPRIQGSLERPNPTLNAFSPIQINPSNSRYDSQLRQIRSKQRTDARIQAIKNRN